MNYDAWEHILMFCDIDTAQSVLLLNSEYSTLNSNYLWRHYFSRDGLPIPQESAYYSADWKDMYRWVSYGRHVERFKQTIIKYSYTFNYVHMIDYETNRLQPLLIIKKLPGSFNVMPASWAGSEYVYRLHLQNNSICKLPRKFAPRYMKVLDLSENHVDKLPDNWPQSPMRLEELFLSKNHITEIPVNFLRADMLLYISRVFLSNNVITRIPKNWPPSCSSIVELYLSNNRIEQIPNNWPLIDSRLQILYLDNNPISAIPSDWLSTYTRLRIINLINTLIPEDDLLAFEPVNVFGCKIDVNF